MRWAVPWLLCALAVAPASAQQTERILDGRPPPGERLEDPEFGIATTALGLERQVEMYQWRSDGSGGVEAVWSAEALIDTDLPGGHANPPFPFSSERWLNERVLLDGRPLDPALYRDRGEWRALPADVSALPPNLAVVFERIDGSLWSSENPASPEVGDLRVSWRQLQLDELNIRLALRDGRWVAAEGLALPTRPLDFPASGRSGRAWLAWLAGGLVLLGLLVLLLQRRR